MWINTYTARLFLASFVMRGFLHQIMLLIHQLLVSAHRFAVTYDFHQLKPFPFICFLSAHMFSVRSYVFCSWYVFFFFFQKMISYQFIGPFHQRFFNIYFLTSHYSLERPRASFAASLFDVCVVLVYFHNPLLFPCLKC